MFCWLQLANSPDILALCETNLDDWTLAVNFSVTGYLTLIWKDSSSDMHGLAGFVKEGLHFAEDLSLENSPSLSLCIVIDSVSPNIRFSQSTHLLFLSLETLTSIIKTGLHILVDLTDLINSIIIFLSRITLLRWLPFLLASQVVILILLLFYIYLFLLMLVFVLQWISFHWEILIMLLSQFPSTFHKIHNTMPRFIA